MLQYAVVSFLDEFIDDEHVVSEVPVTWVHSNNTLCKWPPSFESYHIAKYTVPKPEWSDHRIQLDRIYASREEARRKCTRNPEDDSSSSENITDRRVRKKQPNKMLQNYYTSCPSPPQLYEIGNKYPHADPQDAIGTSNIVSLGSGLTDSEPVQVYGPLQSETEITAEVLQAEEGSVYEELQSVNIRNDIGKDEGNQIPRQSTVFQRGKRPITMDEKLDHLISLVADIKIEIETLKGMKYGRLEAQQNWTEFEVFPIDSLDELKAIDLKLKEVDDCSSRFVQFLKHIGGTCSKDITIRCYKKIFTNNLAEHCSWKGYRSNFKVEDLNLIKCIYDAVNYSYPCTMKEFEILSKDFFRHAKQRREREEKQK